jgi:hypothetical protein
VKIEVGKKYTDGRDVVEIKFIDWEGSGWGLTDERKSCRYIKTYNTAWTEVIDKPDPGEGWRLLHPDEDVTTIVREQFMEIVQKMQGLADHIIIDEDTSAFLRYAAERVRILCDECEGNYRMCNKHAAEINRRRGEMAGVRETLLENGIEGKTILGGLNELLIYKRAMESMAAQLIHPKKTALELAKLQLQID